MMYIIFEFINLYCGIVLYFSKYKFLILIFDFTDFKKADSVVRTKILEGRVFRNENIIR